MLDPDSTIVREVVIAWLIAGILILALAMYPNPEHESIIHAEQTAGFYAA
jgi:hypothetical protein